MGKHRNGRKKKSTVDITRFVWNSTEESDADDSARHSMKNWGLEQQILMMGRHCAVMVADAVDPFSSPMLLWPNTSSDRDDDVDAADIEIEMHCMRLLALQQPMARDLRQIGTALKVITDLERVGDHAVDIAKISRKLTQQLFVRQPLVDVGPLAEMAQKMLYQSLESMVRHDTDLADTDLCRR